LVAYVSGGIFDADEVLQGVAGGLCRVAGLAVLIDATTGLKDKVHGAIDALACRKNIKRGKVVGLEKTVATVHNKNVFGCAGGVVIAQVAIAILEFYTNDEGISTVLAHGVL
jgi:hypothetical protein